MEQVKIGVIGGGASGMMAAIAAADKGSSVTLMEGGARVGKKLLSTGNGKCNLGNMKLSAEEYYGASKEWTAACLEQFDTEDTIRFFEGAGLLLKDKNGYLYPKAEQASVVLDTLRIRLDESGVRTITDCKVDAVRQDSEGGFVVCAGQERFHFDKVILACGSKAAPKTGSDGSGYKLAKGLGHELVPVMPALVQLRCRENYLKEVAGVRAEAVVTVLDGARITAADMGRSSAKAQMMADAGRTGEGARILERGELQLTDYGISGIPVFQLSRQVNYLFKPQGALAEVEVSVNLMPEYTEQEFKAFCDKRESLRDGRTVEEFFTGILNKKLMLLFIKLAGIKRELPASEADEGRLARVYALCRDWRLHVTGSNSFDNAQVCAGGVDTRQVGCNMESLLVPGLYFAGEILDVDGRCGGYNLQWAWCSGAIAGSSAAAVSIQQSC